FFPAERGDVKSTVASLNDSDHRLVEYDFGDFDPARQQRDQFQPGVNVARLDERFFRDVGVVCHLDPGHVGEDSPAEAHFDVVGVNLAAERGADLVEDGLAALGDDRVQVGRGIEEDRAGENHDGSDDCCGDYNDTAHMRVLASGNFEVIRGIPASLVEARRTRITNPDDFPVRSLQIASAV